MPAVPHYVCTSSARPSVRRRHEIYFSSPRSPSPSLGPSLTASAAAAAAARSLDRRSFAIPAAEIALLSGEGGAAAVAAIKLDSTRGASRSGNAGF